MLCCGHPSSGTGCGVLGAMFVVVCLRCGGVSCFVRVSICCTSLFCLVEYTTFLHFLSLAYVSGAGTMPSLSSLQATHFEPQWCGSTRRVRALDNRPLQCPRALRSLSRRFLLPRWMRRAQFRHNLLNRRDVYVTGTVTRGAACRVTSSSACWPDAAARHRGRSPVELHVILLKGRPLGSSYSASRGGHLR